MADWGLIYATDAAGAVTFGSLLELDRAASRGGDIKVAYRPATGVWWSRYCASVTVRGTGIARSVAATYSDALDTGDRPEGVAVGAPLQLEYHVYNSSGFRSFVRFNPATGDVHTELRRMPMRWYARDYEVPLFQWLVTSLVGVFRRDP